MTEVAALLLVAAGWALLWRAGRRRPTSLYGLDDRELARFKERHDA